MSEVGILREDEEKLSHVGRRRLWKKGKRRLKRQAVAKQKEETEMQLKTSIGYLQQLADEEEKLETLQKEEEEERRRDKELWLEREKTAQELFNIRKQKEEENERLEHEMEERKEQEATEKKKRQEELLAQAVPQEPEKREWCNPSAPVHFASGAEKKSCSFFVKTGACRFRDRCSKHHDWPTISQTLLIPNMFTIIELDQQHLNEADQDIELEYDEREIYGKFLAFYEDIKPVFQEVCCNMEPHLRGNVYVQYASEEEASRAFLVFNGRWYAQRQLSVQYTSVVNWKAAICGLFHRNRCPKGRHCNFLHVFRNPRNEFSEMDTNTGDTTHYQDSRRSNTIRASSSIRNDRNSQISTHNSGPNRRQSMDDRYRVLRRRSQSCESRSRSRSRERRSSYRDRRERSKSRSRRGRERGTRERSWSEESGDDSDVVHRSRSPGRDHRSRNRRSRHESRSLSRDRRKKKKRKLRSRSRHDRSRRESHKRNRRKGNLDEGMREESSKGVDSQDKSGSIMNDDEL